MLFVQPTNRGLALLLLSVFTAFGAPEAAAVAPGDLDVSFGQGGIMITDFGGTDVAAAMAIQPDGKIVVAGRTNAGGNATFALARYTVNGGLDPEFGSGGVVVTDFGATDQAFAVALQPDGKIVTAGRRGSDSIVARYNPNGTLDAAFGTGGRVITNFGGANDQALALALYPDGKILFAGRTNNGGNFNFALARYQSSGILDASFGSGGLVTTDFGGSVDRAFALALQPDGKAVVVGDSDANFALARYNLDGSLDTAFGSGGKVITTFGGTDQASAVVLQGDGKIVVAGQTETGVSIDFALARYNPDGSLDAAFGSGGRVTTNFTGSSDDVASAVVLQLDGKIIIAGDTEGNFALARYNPDGSLDGTFGSAGKVTTNLGSNDDLIHAMALQPDGAIVVVGESNDQFALARYHAFPPLSLQLQPNQTEFNTGDSLHLNLTVENLGPPRVVDVYFGGLPGPASHCVGDAIVFFGPGFVPMPTCFSLGSQTFTPLGLNVAIPSGLPSTVIPDFFSLVWTPAWPPGIHTFFLALTRPGTFDLIVVATTAVNLSP